MKSERVENFPSWMGEVDEETICNYAPLKNFYAKWASWTADNLFAFTASRRRRTTNSSSDEENALVIITDKNSFSFNDCTIEGFLFQLSCTQKKILFTEIFFFSSAFWASPDPDVIVFQSFSVLVAHSSQFTFIVVGLLPLSKPPISPQPA